MEYDDGSEEAVEAVQQRRRVRKRRPFWRRRQFWIGVLAIIIAVIVALWLIWGATGTRIESE